MISVYPVFYPGMLGRHVRGKFQKNLQILQNFHYKKFPYTAFLAIPPYQLQVPLQKSMGF
jgi:hypothetical protein